MPKSKVFFRWTNDSFSLAILFEDPQLSTPEYQHQQSPPCIQLRFSTFGLIVLTYINVLRSVSEEEQRRTPDQVVQDFNIKLIQRVRKASDHLRLPLSI